MAFNDGIAVLCLRKREVGDWAIRQLAGALAGSGLGSLVRIDYAKHEVFAYTRFPSMRLVRRFQKSSDKAYSPFYTTLLGRRVAIRCAKGWRFGLHDEAPPLLTDDVVSYDVDCPDAGEGDWEHWKAKVLAYEVGADGNPFADLEADDITTMLRCRRWAGGQSESYDRKVPMLGAKLEQHQFNQPFQKGWINLLDFWRQRPSITKYEPECFTLSCAEIPGIGRPCEKSLQTIIVAEKQLMRCAQNVTLKNVIIGPGADYMNFSLTGSCEPGWLDSIERVEWAMAKLACRLKPYGGQLIVYRS